MAAKVLDFWQSELGSLLSILCPDFLVISLFPWLSSWQLRGPTGFLNVSDCLFARPTAFVPPFDWLRCSPPLPRAPIARLPSLWLSSGCARTDRSCLLPQVPWWKPCGLLWHWSLWLNPCDTRYFSSHLIVYYIPRYQLRWLYRRSSYRDSC